MALGTRSKRRDKQLCICRGMFSPAAALARQVPLNHHGSSIVSVFYMSYKVIPSGKFDFAVFKSAMSSKITLN